MIGAAAVAALAVTGDRDVDAATSVPRGARRRRRRPPSHDVRTCGETTTTAAGGHHDRDATSTSTADSAPATTTAPTDFTAALDRECEGDTGHPAAGRRGCRTWPVPDGSLRIIEILRTCDVEFVGPVDEALGRPLTNVEA